MEEPSPIFTLPFGDAESVELRNKSTEYVEVFHQSLPSGDLLENDEAIQQFLSSKDLLEEPDLNGPTTLHCEICSKKFDNAKKYYGHLRVHSNKADEWICDKCPNGKFTTKQQLMKHSLIHKPLERIWKCPQCPMVFEVLFRLQQHLFAKHLNCRPHKCGLCEKAFNKHSDLKKHEAVHSLKRKFPCEICHQRFADRSNLQRHAQTHSKEKPFVCTGCGNRYTQIASLRRHTKTCEAAKQKVQALIPSAPPRLNYCRVCGVTFQYKAQLLEHYDKIHSHDAFHTLLEGPCEASATDGGSVVQLDTESNNVKLDIVSQFEAITSVNNDQEEKEVTRDDQEDHVDEEYVTPQEYAAPHSEYTSNLMISNDQINADSTVVDTIVEDILSVEDEYRIVNRKPMQNCNEIVQAIKREALIKENALKKEKNARLQQEFLKEMHQLNSLEDELFYSDIDFDLHPNHVFNMNTNDIDLSNQERNGEMLFDFADGSRSIEQDIMNALYHDKTDQLPDELLNVSADDQGENGHLLSNHVSINECATIFETDVDLEASTNLAANLNQLIGENNVRYVSTEHDDTFIISLNSGIDAEKLSDMLNIGGELDGDVNLETSRTSNNNEENLTDNEVPEARLDKVAADAIVFKIPETVVKPEVTKDGENQNKENTEVITKSRREVLYVCRYCEKVFNRRENYWCHLAVHEPSLRRHGCPSCGLRFSYPSSLAKHVRSAHEPRAPPRLVCPRPLCRKRYRSGWMLKEHLERDHNRATPHACPAPGCGRKFYKKSDLNVHSRFHTGERPYGCGTCGRRFQHCSHLRRHQRSPACAQAAYNPRKSAFKPTNSTPPRERIKRDTSETTEKNIIPTNKGVSESKDPIEPLANQRENIFNPKLVAFKPLKQPPPLIKRDTPKFNPKKDMQVMNIKIAPKTDTVKGVTITKIITENVKNTDVINQKALSINPKPTIKMVPIHPKPLVSCVQTEQKTLLTKLVPNFKILPKKSPDSKTLLQKLTSVKNNLSPIEKVTNNPLTLKYLDKESPELTNKKSSLKNISPESKSLLKKTSSKSMDKKVPKETTSKAITKKVIKTPQSENKSALKKIPKSPKSKVQREPKSKKSLLKKILSDPNSKMSSLKRIAPKPQAKKTLVKKLPLDPLSIKQDYDVVLKQGKQNDAKNKDGTYYFLLMDE